MINEMVKEQINNQEPDFLLKANKKGYICPICGQGTRNGNGIVRDPKDGHYHCFGCGEHMDVIDLYGKHNNIAEYTEQVKGACRYYGIEYKQAEYTAEQKSALKPAQLHAEIKEDYTTLYNQWNAELKVAGSPAQAYLKKRGISIASAGRFKLGYCDKWTHPKAPNATPTPRLIIPTSNSTYLARDIREDIPDSQKQYSKSKVGRDAPLFNEQALYNTEPVIITEGELDAISIMEVGGNAVGLGSIARVKRLKDLADNGKIKAPLVLCLDNDTAGNRASEEAFNYIKGIAGVSVYEDKEIYGDCKDANELLTTAPESLYEAVAGIMENPDKYYYEKQNNVNNYLQGFVDSITASVDYTAVSTGFNNLDELLDGGLYAGLYGIGAISSLGKTTLVQQIADQIAQQGKDIMFISLEMSRNELIAKSVSRQTLQRVQAGFETASIKDAKTVRGITDGKRYAGYNETEKRLISQSIRDYETYGKHIYILEGTRATTVRYIRNKVRQHIDVTGNKPVLFIDYLQLIQPEENSRLTDKQLTDINVMELKRISREFNIPVVVISSLNRQRYLEPISMQAFKESGAIEYSTDVLIGLQLKGVGSNDFNVDEAKQREPREIELKILKNRNGKTGTTAEFNYYAMFNCYQENEIKPKHRNVF